MTSYKDAGVDIDSADNTKRAMRKSIDTGDKRVINKFGAFASLVEGSFPGFKDAVLVLKTEEPGSKQKLAFDHGYVKSICFDTINHLINDIAVMGAHPQYVQDAVICGKIQPEVVTQIVDGFASACKEQGCVLVGGETSEQPGVLPVGTYILTASIVGVVERSQIIDGSTIKKGDSVIAVASNGLHTNGYSLARKLMEEYPALAEKNVAGETFIAAIMKPHTCYLKGIKDLFLNKDVHGMAHITGGGIAGNLNRILPKTLSAQIDLSKIEVLPIFTEIQSTGDVPDSDMLKTYNMGVGLTIVCAPEASNDIIKHLESKNYHAYEIGFVVDGDGEIQFENNLQP